MTDTRTEELFRQVVAVADRAVDRYRQFAGGRHDRPVAELLRGLVDEARQRAAEVERAYFLVVGRPFGRLGGDGADAGVDDLGVPTGESELLRRTLDDFRAVHALMREAGRQVPPGLARKTLVDLARAEETRIEAFTAAYRSTLVPGAATRTTRSRI